MGLMPAATAAAADASVISERPGVNMFFVAMILYEAVWGGGGGGGRPAARGGDWLAREGATGGSERCAITSRTMPAANRQPRPLTRTLARKSARDTLVGLDRHHVARHRERGEELPRLSNGHHADLEVLDHQQAVGMLDPVERGHGVADAARDHDLDGNLLKALAVGGGQDALAPHLHVGARRRLLDQLLEL